MHQAPRAAMAMYDAIKSGDFSQVHARLAEDCVIARDPGHLERIFVKLGVETRTAAAGRALAGLRVE